MPYYRSYKKVNSDEEKYSYTCWLNGSPFTDVSATPVNNSSFNFPIVVGNNVYRLDNFLRNCTNFNCDIVIPQSVMTTENMLANCPNFGANIYIQHGTRAYNNMLPDRKQFPYANNAKIVNIFIPSTIKNPNRASGYIGVSSLYMNWQNIDNGWYSSNYNLYVYNNYTW